MKNHYEFQVKALDRWLGGIRNALRENADTNFYGMWVSRDSDYIEPTLTPHLAAFATYGYYVKGTSYYHQSEWLEMAIRALTAYKNSLHEDGTIDLLETNFHDPAQCGFVSREALSAIEVVARYTEHTPLEDELYGLYLEILKLHGEAMLNCGFHTPNHRWVISSAMALLYRHTHDERYMNYIKGFLKEGIDCDENGEYTERSSGRYNVVCALSFTKLALYLDDPSFYEYPIRNLRLMESFVDPDGKMCTANSVRQDRLHRTAPYSIYYPYYLFYALEKKDPEFAYIADSMLHQYELAYDRGEAPVNLDAIELFLIHPSLREGAEQIQPKAPERDKTCFLPESGIARLYRPDLNMTVTLVRHSPVFMTVIVGSHCLQFRYAGAFFGDPHSQFRARQIMKTETGYRLFSDETAGYRSQLDEAPETSDWHKMDHSKRRLLNIQHFIETIDVELLGDGFALTVKGEGAENILTKLEILAEPGGRFDTDEVASFLRAGDYVFLKNGRFLYTMPDSTTFDIRGGFYDHSYGKSMRGALPVDGGDTVFCMTAHTPHENRLEIHIGYNTYQKERRKAEYEAISKKQPR